MPGPKAGKRQETGEYTLRIAKHGSRREASAHCGDWCSIDIRLGLVGTLVYVRADHVAAYAEKEIITDVHSKPGVASLGSEPLGLPEPKIAWTPPARTDRSFGPAAAF